MVRPEDVVLTEHRDQLAVPVVGSAKVMEMQFVGAIERLRLEVQATETLASAQRPGAATFFLDASRTARDVEVLPLETGRRVVVGLKRMHTLPTPISSLRLIATARMHDAAASGRADRARARGANAYRAVAL